MARPVFLPRLLSKWGFCSRKRAEELVAAGRVRVDGRVRRDVLCAIDPERAQVEVDGVPLQRARLLYAAMHKPTGVVTTASDPRGRPTVLDLLPPALAGAMPVGRLDRDSSGLLLFTNDHELGDRVASGACEKVYRVLVPGGHGAERFAPLRAGMDLDGRRLLPMAVRVLRRPGGDTLLEIRLREGKNRQIRRALARLGLDVRALERVAIGPLRLGALAPGGTRPLTRAEVAALRRACVAAPR